jgi:hypothetical protein
MRDKEDSMPDTSIEASLTLEDLMIVYRDFGLAAQLNDGKIVGLTKEKRRYKRLRNLPTS